jgi:SAM-dependent methyltransferase
MKVKSKSEIAQDTVPPSRFLMLARLHIPFTALNTVRRHLDKGSRSILDLGCGKGDPMLYLNRSGAMHAIGADIWKPTLLETKQRQTHDDYVLCDVRKLPFQAKSADIAMCLEVLEHMDKESGIQLLSEMEMVARRQVIINTPLGKYKQGALEGNPHQLHVYMWNPADMRGLGYKVVTMGLRQLGGDEGLGANAPEPIKRILDMIYVLAGPITRFITTWAGEMVCIKNMDSVS